MNGTWTEWQYLQEQLRIRPDQIHCVDDAFVSSILDQEKGPRPNQTFADGSSHYWAVRIQRGVISDLWLTSTVSIAMIREKISELRLGDHRFCSEAPELMLNVFVASSWLQKTFKFLREKGTGSNELLFTDLLEAIDNPEATIWQSFPTAIQTLLTRYGENGFAPLFPEPFDRLFVGFLDENPQEVGEVLKGFGFTQVEGNEDRKLPTLVGPDHRAEFSFKSETTEGTFPEWFRYLLTRSRETLLAATKLLPGKKSREEK